MPSQLAVSRTLSATVRRHIEQPIVTHTLHDDASLSHQLRTMSELQGNYRPLATELVNRCGCHLHDDASARLKGSGTPTYHVGTILTPSSRVNPHSSARPFLTTARSWQVRVGTGQGCLTSHPDDCRVRRRPPIFIALIDSIGSTASLSCSGRCTLWL